MNDEEFKIIIDGDADDAIDSLEEMGGMFSGLGATIAGFAAAAGAALLALAGIIVGKAIKSTEDLERAVSKMGQQTGASKEEFKGFEDSIKSIYSQNWGESFADIGEAMSEIKRQTNLSGKALESMTKDALILRDVFEFEVGDSTRAANQLMQNFGISSKEAFNLIAQGAQKGLNKNDDLLDTINEYSIQFKAIGMDSDQMFDTLMAGAESGAWSIDKIGDSIKEFTIRSKDGSKASAEAFEMLGLDAGKMTKAFAKGGKEANNAFYQVIDALGAMKDPVKQNAAGVGLFGTMIEDLGVEGIVSLGNITDGFNKTKDTMGELDKSTFFGITEALNTFGRMLELNILIPLGKLIMPLIKEFTAWVGSNLPAAIEVFKQIAGFIGSVFGPVFMKAFNDIKKQLGEFITNSGGMKTALTPIFDAVKNMFKALADFWATYADIIINQILPNILNYLKVWLPIILGVFVGIINGLTGMYKMWTSIFNFLGPIVGGVLGYVVTAFTNFVSFIKGVITVFSGVLQGDWRKAWTGVKMIFSSIGNIIKSIMKAWFNVVKMIFKNGLNIVVGVIKISFNLIKSVIFGALNASKTVVLTAMNGILNTFKTRGGNIKTVFASLVTYIKDKISGLAKSAYNWGVNFLSSFTKGIKSRIKELKNMVYSAAKELKNLLGFSSPTKEGPGKTANKWAPNFMDMFIKGLNMRQMALKNTTTGMAQVLSDAANVTNPIREVGAAVTGGGGITVTGNSFMDQHMIDLIMQRAVRMIKGRR